MEVAAGVGIILSLIQLFQHSRDKSESAEKEDFYSWLLDHKFQDVKDCITNNFALEAEIANILKINHDELLSRLDGIDVQLARIIHGIDAFRGVATVVAPSACLTKNQEELLKALVKSGGTSFTFAQTFNGLVFYGNGPTPDLSNVDTKFMPQSLEALAACGFLMRGGKGYLLTESGQEYIDLLDGFKTDCGEK